MQKTTNLLDCTIIFLSYNSKDVTDECLNRLEKATAYAEKKLKNGFKIVVVDNGSHDGSAEMIKKKYPSVKLLAMKENLGYVEGNNLAMKQIDTPYFLLMNSDTYINEDTLYKAYEEMTDNPSIDALVCRFVYDTGGLQLDGGYLPTPRRILLWAMGFESLPIVNRFLPNIYGFREDVYTKPRVVEWFSPCFMLVKREVYETVGGFDTDLWFHMVDIEWCKRVFDAGFTMWFTPKIEVIHLGGASSKGLNSRLLKDNFKGKMHYFKKHYPKRYDVIRTFIINGAMLRGLYYQARGNSELAKTYTEISQEL